MMPNGMPGRRPFEPGPEHVTDTSKGMAVMTTIISAYTDSLSYRAGDVLRLYASGPVGRADVTLVRLTRNIVTSPGDPDEVAWAGSQQIQVQQ